MQDGVEFSCVNLAKKCRGDKITWRLQQLHPQQPRTLSADKVRDIQKLMKYIPPVHHGFYAKLESNAVSNVSYLCEDELLGPE